MAEKFNSDKKLGPKELAKHLRQPTGETGKAVGIEMNKGNKHICLNSYDILNPKAGNSILEIGMGNGFFVKDLFQKEKELTYVGVDFSSEMVEEATQFNQDLIKKGKVAFYEASIEKLPFEDDFFDCITTTNTLYFWPEPDKNIKELLRVLKPQGKLLVAYRSKDLMDQIELSQFGFEKYDVPAVECLFKTGGFNEINTRVINEPDLEFDDKPFKMQGYYTIGLK